MTKNPYINALAALAYIAALISVLFYGPVVDGPLDNTILIPIAMLSLFVFSAAAMAYVFLYNPLLLILEGKKKEGIKLFLSTLFAFGAMIVVLLLSALLIARLS
ncbi:MAG TPA: hypothetical protein VGP13_01955 [Candidatus Paceibacterota bacterium]|jgi:hypothetical protein|nr:hypothetical protein [Candidatus Paceibacterota bacterium]